VLKLFALTDALRTREEAQTLAEYGVLLAVVTLLVVASLTVLSGSVQNAFESTAGLLPG
jgi:Flp pilus assembly pilin Flp